MARSCSRSHEGVRQRGRRGRRRLAGDRRRRVHGPGRPSGCGKTTILRMIAGLEEVTAGEITIGDGRSPTWRPKDRDMAMVFQNYALYPHMTVEQNLGFGLRLRRTPKDERAARVSEVAADPRPRAPARPQARRAVRRAAPAGRDRPGDGPRARRLPDGRAAVQPGRQAARADAGRARAPARAARTTTVYVTHDQVEAMTLGRPGGGGARRRAPAGRHAAAPATPNPVNLFVAAFIGSPPMNLVEARRSRAATISFGGSALPLGHATDLLAYDGRTVILGIRPSDFEDADVWRDDALPTIEVAVEVTEELGSEVNVLFTVDAPPVHDRGDPRRGERGGGATNPADDRGTASSARGSTRGRGRSLGIGSRSRSIPPFPLLRAGHGAGHLQRTDGARDR